MIKYNNTNNASTTLTAGISPSSTTLIVENGDILPTAPFLLTLEHFDNEKVTVREIVKCIAKAGNILTIQRGAGTCVQDDSASTKEQGNSAHSFSVGDCASIYWTSEQVQDIQNEIEKKLDIDDFQAGTYVYGATSTGTDAYSITIPGTLTSYAVGQVFRFMADVDNEGNATLNINGLGAVEIRKNHDKILDNGDIEAGQIVEVAYDGTYFQMDSQVASVIDLGAIDSNVLTGMAGENIQENDIVVLGGWRDSSVADKYIAIGGAENNKLAIPFTTTNDDCRWFKIKACFIEDHEPDSVVLNICEDNNGTPGTVVSTISNGKDYIVNNEDPAVSKTYGLADAIGEHQVYYPNMGYNLSTTKYVTSAFGFGYGQIKIVDSGTNQIISINTPDGLIYMDFGLKTDIPGEFNSCTNNGHFFVYNTGRTIYGIYCPTAFSTDGMVVTTGARTSGQTSRDRTCMFSVTNDGKYILCTGGANSSNVVTVYVLTLDTPYDVSSFTETGYGALMDSNRTMCYYEYKNEHYFYFDSKFNSTIKKLHIKIAEDGTVTSTSGIESPFEYYTCTYYGDEVYIINTNGLLYAFGPVADFVGKDHIFRSPVALSSNTKYRLTIEPTITGTVVDCMKVFYTDGDENDVVCVRDLNNRRAVNQKKCFFRSPCTYGNYLQKYENGFTKINRGTGGEEAPLKLRQFYIAKTSCNTFEHVNVLSYGIKGGFKNLTIDEKYYAAPAYKDYEVGINITKDKILFCPSEKNTLQRAVFNKYNGIRPLKDLRILVSGNLNGKTITRGGNIYITFPNTDIITEITLKAGYTYSTTLTSSDVKECYFVD